jgi:tol-pal system protein YbgF
MMGCSSGAAHGHARHAGEVEARDAEMAALRLELDSTQQELRTVRGQLALARAEVQELKGRAERAPKSLGPKATHDELPWAKDIVVEERLTVTSDVPDLPAFEEPEPAAAPDPVAAPATPEVDVSGYRRGLQLVRDQRFDEAEAELEAFVRQHPSHPYADNALFWCGEIHYLQREYATALEQFDKLLKLYPWGNKAPDALYRMGQIYLRRGDKARAQAYFDKVREQFPDTAAARLALREDAS